LRPYSARLDKAVIDYADFSRNPEKYGFKKVSFGDGAYWEHEQMNLPTAVRLTKELRTKLQDANVSNSFVTSSFQYSHLRGLGFSQADIFRFTRHSRWNDSSHDLVRTTNQEAISAYAAKVPGRISL
jgi:hypothetical protein